MYHAHIIEQHCDESTEGAPKELSMILGELDRVNSELSRYTKVHWSNFRDIPKGAFIEYSQKTFLASAIQAKLTLYVQDILKPSDVRDKRGRPLLDYALRPNMITPIELPEFGAKPDFEMVRVLVERGADINKKVYIYDNKSVWGLFLEQCYDKGVPDARLPEKESKDFFSVIELLIKKGADVNITFAADEKKSIGIADAFKAFLGGRDFEALEQLLVQRRKAIFNIWKFVGWS